MACAPHFQLLTIPIFLASGSYLQSGYISIPFAFETVLREDKDEQYKLSNFDYLNFETQKQVKNYLFELIRAILMIFWCPFIKKVSLLSFMRREGWRIKLLKFSIPNPNIHEKRRIENCTSKMFRKRIII